MCTDDKWLEVTPAELDHMIEEVQGIKLLDKQVSNLIVVLNLIV